MKTNDDKITPALRQLLVEAAAELEDLTDEGGYEVDAVRRFAGRLRDAAAGRQSMRTWDVSIQTMVAVEVPADVDPDTDEGVAIIKQAAKAKFIAAIEEDSFDIGAEEYCGE